MSEATATYRFFSWLRQGLLAGVTSGSAQTVMGHVSLPIRLRVNDTNDVDVPIELYGPGDVTGLDAREVIRVDPQQAMTDFEPNYFPLIEFDRPDFPWLFAPTKPDTGNRLMPWICLAVIRKDAATLVANAGTPLPVLQCPKRELPDLAQAWAWAHTQIVSGATSVPDPPRHDALKQILNGQPERTLSRLLGPRRLDANTDYIACLVPTYDIGRKIGLGEAITAAEEQALAPAWATNTDPSATVRLPAYYHWEFRTGAGGDFESLARRLEPRPLPATVGLRAIDISAPGWGMPATAPGSAGALLQLAGALRSPDTEPADWPAAARDAFQSALRRILNFPAERAVPGAAEALRAAAVAEQEDRRRRLAELRLLLAQAPETRAELLAAEKLAQGLARRITKHAAKEPPKTIESDGKVISNKKWKSWARYHKRLINEHAKASAVVAAQRRRLSELEQLQQEIAALETTLRADTQDGIALGPPLYGQWYAKQQRVPAQSDAPHWFRELNLDPRLRVAAGLGTLVVRFEQEQLMASAWDQLARQEQDNARLKRAQLAETVGDALLNKHIAPLPPTRLLQLTSPVHAAINRNINGRAFAAATARLSSNDPSFSAAYRRFNRALGPLDSRIEHMRSSADRAQVRSGSLNLGLDASGNHLRSLKNTVLAQLDTKAAVLAAVRRDLPATESIDLIRYAPQFPQPMYEAMRDYFQDMLLPGMEHVPPNSIALLETNQQFVEAYMVGLNHEMSRELLWRGFPTDQRGTYFRQFWDVRGNARSLDQAQRERLYDIAPIAAWTDASHLGEHSARDAAEGQMVLLIRGDLLRRYPRATVYAVEANWSADKKRRDLGTTEVYPSFRATQGQDITMLGFTLTEQQVRGADDANGHAGWFFVLQEQPTEPRFGIDVATSFGGTPHHWRDLTWGHLATAEAALKQIVYVPLDGALKEVVADGIAWGKNSAHMAAITRQRPFRVAIHARTWLLGPIEP